MLVNLTGPTVMGEPSVSNCCEPLGGGDDAGLVEPLLEGLLEVEHGGVVGDLDLEGERGLGAGDDGSGHGVASVGVEAELLPQEPLKRYIDPRSNPGKLLGDVPTATAILDRFLHHAEVVSMNGRSYRLRDRPGPSPEAPRFQNQPRGHPSSGAPRRRGRLSQSGRSAGRLASGRPSDQRRRSQSGERKPVDV